MEPDPQPPESPVAQHIGRAWINDDPVDAGVIEAEFNRLLGRYRDDFPDRNPADHIAEIRRDSLENAAEGELLRREAAQQIPPPSEKDIDRKIREWLKEIGGRKAFDPTGREDPLKLPELRAEADREIRYAAYLEKLTSVVPAPTEEELQGVFDADPDAFREPVRLSVRFVLLGPEQGLAPDNATQLLNILQMIQGGKATFDEVYHGLEEKGLATSFDRMRLDLLEEEFGAGIARQPPGPTPAYYSTSRGQVLVQVVDRTEGRDPDFEEARKIIRDRLWHRRKEAAVGAHVDAMRQATEIRVEPAENEAPAETDPPA